MNRWLSVFAIAFLLPPTVSAQLSPQDGMKSFTVADGLELSLFASEPMFVNPTSIDIDHKGRVWVCEAVNYRQKMRGKPPLRKEGDRIVVLVDKDGDGKADEGVTFYQAPEVMSPLGIAVAAYPDGKGQKVYVCQSPNIWVFEDKDGDLKADGPPKVLLTGFQGIDHDHGVHGVSIGPDRKLYFTVGDSGVKNLQASDGKGKVWSSNTTDCRAGTVWRCDMDGKNLELIAHNFRNNYEACVDSFGSVFLSDNDDDGNQQTRICYVMPGGNYGYHPRGPGQTHWHEEQPGIVHKIMRTGFGSPCGILAYEGNLLPKKYHGQLIHADSGPREIRCFHLKPNGAGYDVEKELLVTSKDNWFRASDVCTAPDGSVFIADWYDPGVGGHGMGDTTRGRIYRLTPKGHKGYKVPEYKSDDKADSIEALASPNLTARALGMATIQASEVATAIKSENPYLRARAWWQVLQSDIPRMHINPVPTEGAAKDRDPRIQVQAIEMNKRWATKFSKAPALMLEGKPFNLETAAARRELLLAVRDIEPSIVSDGILDLASKYDGKDRFYLNAIGIAVGTDPERRKVILADFDKHFPEWNEKVADLVWELRPPSMMPKLGKLLSDKALSASSRGRIIDILAASDDKGAGKAMLDVLQSDVPAEVRTQALANLKLFLPTRWKDLRDSDDLEKTITGLLAKNETRAIGLDLIGAVEKVAAIDTVVKIALGAQETLPVRQAAVRALGAIPHKGAVKELLNLANVGEPALIESAVQSLGRLAALTDRQHKPIADDSLNALQGLFKTGAATTRNVVLTTLIGTRQGTVWLLEQHEKKAIPSELLADVGRLVRNTPFVDLRNRAMVAFPPAGKIDPKKIPPISALLTRKGDANRGKQLYAASLKNDMQCAKCHMVRGQGGQIGPDLSMIGKKASRENLLESILLPSKAVADQYVNWQIETGKGLVLNGLIVEETPTSVVLRDANGKDNKVEKKDIESRTKSPKSLMPEDIVVYLSEDELIDLTEYMLTLKTAALTPTAWHIAGPFPNGTNDEGIDKDFGPEKQLDLKATYQGKTGKVSWGVVRPDGTGYIDLARHFSAEPTEIVSYLYQEIESPADQEATILIGHDDACKVFVNGEKVHEDRQHLAAKPEANQAKVKLKKGVNKVLVKINNGSIPHGLYFTIIAEQELKQREVK